MVKLSMFAIVLSLLTALAFFGIDGFIVVALLLMLLLRNGILTLRIEL